MISLPRRDESWVPNPPQVFFILDTVSRPQVPYSTLKHLALHSCDSLIIITSQLPAFVILANVSQKDLEMSLSKVFFRQVKSFNFHNILIKVK